VGGKSRGRLKGGGSLRERRRKKKKTKVSDERQGDSGSVSQEESGGGGKNHLTTRRRAHPGWGGRGKALQRDLKGVDEQRRDLSRRPHSNLVGNLGLNYTTENPTRTEREKAERSLRLTEGGRGR